jgi:hypothetical protein
VLPAISGHAQDVPTFELMIPGTDKIISVDLFAGRKI